MAANREAEEGISAGRDVEELVLYSALMCAAVATAVILSVMSLRALMSGSSTDKCW